MNANKFFEPKTVICEAILVFHLGDANHESVPEKMYVGDLVLVKLAELGGLNFLGRIICLDPMKVYIAELQRECEIDENKYLGRLVDIRMIWKRPNNDTRCFTPEYYKAIYNIKNKDDEIDWGEPMRFEEEMVSKSKQSH